jgi:hypothetical protein
VMRHTEAGTRQNRVTATRAVKCQCCPWWKSRAYGARGILVNPCPECGSRVEYAATYAGEQPVSLGPKLMAKAA